MVKAFEFVHMISNHDHSCAANLETSGFCSVYDLKHNEEH